MKLNKGILKSNKKLLSFMALSYFDKAIIFLLPLIVLQLFKDKSIYLTIEYIYSIVIVVIPFLDFGLISYFFYIYRNEKNKKKTINDVTRIFQLLYFILSVIGIVIIVIHYYIYYIDEYIVYVVSRVLFVVTFSFLASYYRLINKPHKGLYVTIFSNLLSLSFLFVYVLIGQPFYLWLIFIGQILFSIFYFLKISRNIFLKWVTIYKKLPFTRILKASLLFAWPGILQVFIMMYIANYGKIHALDNMSLNDGTLLSLTQRFSMLIQITHTAVLAYIIKEMYVSGNVLAIKKRILFKYLTLLSSTAFFVFLIILGYLVYNNIGFSRTILIVAGIIAYTYFWSISAYLEVYFSRENKNILKLYLALINAFIFVLILSLNWLDYLEKITMAMLISITLSLATSIIILKKRKYYLA